VMQALLRLAAAGGPRGELAPTILLLAGTLAITRAHAGGAPPPLPLVVDLAGRRVAVVRPLFRVVEALPVDRAGEAVARAVRR
jgi:hypothetical protein